MVLPLLFPNGRPLSEDLRGVWEDWSRRQRCLDSDNGIKKGKQRSLSTYRAIVDGESQMKCSQREGVIPKYKSIWISSGVALLLRTHIQSTGNFVGFNINTSTMCVITVDVALVRSPQASNSPQNLSHSPE